MEFTIERMCKVLDVSKSAYYSWKHNKGLKHVKHHVLLLEEIKNVFKESYSVYGSPRITQSLLSKGIQVSKATVARVMSKNNIHSKVRKKFKVTTDSNHKYDASPNVLDRNFNPQELNQVWVSDITYLRVGNSWCYLTIIMDLADRMVIAWNLSNNMTTSDTIIKTWNKALEVRKIVKPLIFHSDRGVQYACGDFREALGKSKFITQSMSRKGNCWDNAVAESFFKTLKSEFVNHYSFFNYDQAYRLIFQYLEGWYNTRRKHSSLNYLSPVQMHYLITTKIAA
jgi:putative transposase